MRVSRLALRPEDRCVVTLTFDNFGESFDLLQHGYAGGALADGVYAPRRGVERILGLLEHYQAPATFFAEGWSVDRYSGLIKKVIERGHEVAAHGWMHENWNSLDIEMERELIERTTQTITEVTGKAPRGWRSPGGLVTPNTLSLLSQTGYSYDSSFGDDDTPYLMQVQPKSHQRIVEIPWQWALDDAMYYSPQRPIRSASEVANIWIEEFDAAIQTTGFFILVCHPRYSGRPARLFALEKLLDHIRSHNGVRFVRCDDVVSEMNQWSAAPSFPAPEMFSTREGP